MTAWRISGFADEVFDEFAKQLEFFATLGLGLIDVRHFDRAGLRCSIADSTAVERDRLAGQLTAAGIACQSVASPIGKSPVGEDMARSQRQLGNCLAAADRFGASYVRIFGFQTERADEHGACVARLQALCTQAASEAPGVTLLLENERAVFGETPAQILTALERTGADNLAYVCDPCNFAVVGIDPWLDACPQLWDRICAFHVKDLGDDRQMVPAGAGRCNWPKILSAAAERKQIWNLALEPHLDLAGRHRGLTSPEGFVQAKSALDAILAAVSGSGEIPA